MPIALVLSLHASDKGLSLLFLAHLTFELHNLPAPFSTSTKQRTNLLQSLDMTANKKILVLNASTANCNLTKHEEIKEKLSDIFTFVLPL